MRLVLVRATRSFNTVEVGELLQVDLDDERMAAHVASGFFDVIEDISGETLPAKAKNRGAPAPQ